MEEAMILDEDEALEKVCPFTRNKANDDKCIGTLCMAWQWRNAEGFGYCALVRDEGEAERSA
jgi:hypothetical protein